ncbi:transducin beta-like protein 3 [Nylanderia fulva]|uniref:transducin beta-like protein 3 n=1 Tax=Nylanderia fulva TaxID=613905 RepID=UPI0010FB0223|nr:transducin beta-like protein 3 [Nylanderia fulva]XP_029172396.1 transducin beta-like protein 3 [Nylanderia fulva]
MSIKEAFEVECKHGAFYTGGDVQWSADAEYLFCQKGGTISILSVSKSSVISLLGEIEKNDQQEDTINCFALADNDTSIFTHHKSGLFKLWDWKVNKLIKLWKSIHNGPVTRITFSNNNTLMASGGSDSAVRLWNLQHHTCTHNLKGVQGVISVLKFHPDSTKQLLFAAGDDTKIHGWDINTGQKKVTLSGHFSKVTSLNFHENGNYVISSGRDKVLILWDISSATSVRVLPVYEGIEGAFIILPQSLPAFIKSYNDDDIYIASAGEKGIVKIWEIKAGKLIYTQDNSLVSPAKEEGSLSITHLLYNSIHNIFAIVSVDHNIIIHSLESFECKKQLVGYSDEILDVAYLGANDSHIALATNSCDIKLYDVGSMNCQLLCGHSDSILALATTPANVNLLISSAKDNSVRIWLFDKEMTRMSCIGSAIRHTASISSVAISQTSTKFFTTVAQDSCLKLWELSNNLDSHKQNLSLNPSYTMLAHQKEMNCVTISPNDKLIATASQDKTAKLWSAEDLQLLGVFHGHRRGVWCVRFSPIDQVLLTTSADCTMKLWSLTELNCLKTFEGHESSVLRGEFLSHGMQLITSGGDGLLKLWNIKTSECISTLDQHESHVWTLVVAKDEKHIISGGSDSLLVIWRDVTEERRTQIAQERERLVFEEQKLANLLKAEELQAALQLALKMERPLQVLKIIEALLQKQSDELVEIIRDLKPARKEALLKCAISWNTNSRNSHAAQIVINALMTEIGTQELQIPGLSSTLESMIPYTDRHFKRLTKLLQDLHLLTYTVNCMKPDIISVGNK